MEKESALYQLMGIRMRSIMNRITSSAGEYPEIIWKKDKYLHQSQNVLCRNCKMPLAQRSVEKNKKKAGTLSNLYFLRCFFYHIALLHSFDVYLTIRIITMIATNSSVTGIANQIESAPTKAGRA